MSKLNQDFKVEQHTQSSIVGSFVPLADEKIQQLSEDIARISVEIKTIHEQYQKEKTDFVGMVGIFAALITFVTVEFQFLKTIHSGERIIGFSMLFWSLLVTFNIILMFLLDNSQGEWVEKKAKKYWVLMLFVGMTFSGGLFFIIRSNEEMARENKIYEKFSEEFGQRLRKLEKIVHATVAKNGKA